MQNPNGKPTNLPNDALVASKVVPVGEDDEGPAGIPIGRLLEEAVAQAEDVLRLRLTMFQAGWLAQEAMASNSDGDGKHK